MAERAGAAVDVDLLVGKAEIAHGGHGDDGEGLVDFEEIDIRKRPASALEQRANSADGRGGKKRRAGWRRWRGLRSRRAA
jgi:hypothetical protein